MIGPGGGRHAHTGMLPLAAAELFRRIARAEEDANAAAGAAERAASAFEVSKNSAIRSKLVLLGGLRAALLLGVAASSAIVLCESAYHTCGD